MNFITKFICDVFDLVPESDLKDATAALHTAESRAQELEELYNSANAKYEQTVEDLSTVSAKLTNALEEAKKLEGERDIAVETASKLSETVVQTQEKLDQTLAVVADQSTEIENLKHQLETAVDGTIAEELNKQIETLTAEKEELNKQIENLTTNIIEVNATLETVRAESASKDETINSLNESVQQMQAKNDELDGINADLNQQLATAKANLDEYAVEVDLLNDKITEHTNTITTLTTEKEALTTELTAAKEKIAELEAQLNPEPKTATVTVIPNEETRVLINGEEAQEVNEYPIGTHLTIEGVPKDPNSNMQVVLKVSEAEEESTVAPVAVASPLTAQPEVAALSAQPDVSVATAPNKKRNRKKR